MKLKTLKDFEPHTTHWHPDEKHPENITYIETIDIKELKQEAIKQYKSNQKHPRKEETFRLLHFIKHFFNLTEEDLK